MFDPPELVHALHLEVEVGPPLEIGDLSSRLRRVVPITGAMVSGPLIMGRMLAGGTDFQLIRSETETEVEAATCSRATRVSW